MNQLGTDDITTTKQNCAHILWNVYLVETFKKHLIQYSVLYRNMLHSKFVLYGMWKILWLFYWNYPRGVADWQLCWIRDKGVTSPWWSILLLMKTVIFFSISIMPAPCVLCRCGSTNHHSAERMIGNFPFYHENGTIHCEKCSDDEPPGWNIAGW